MDHAAEVPEDPKQAQQPSEDAPLNYPGQTDQAGSSDPEEPSPEEPSKFSFRSWLAHWNDETFRTLSFRKLKKVYRPRPSFYAKTAWRAALSVAFCFAILGASYLYLLGANAKQQEAFALRTFTQALTNEIVRMNPDQNGIRVTSSLRTLVNFAAASDRSMIWLVNADGRIVYYSSMPINAWKGMAKDEDNRFILPPELLTSPMNAGQPCLGEGNFYGLLDLGQTWLTASMPLINANKEYGGEVIVHRSLDQSKWHVIYTSSNIVLAFIFAGSTAIILILLMSVTITDPIKTLAKVARQVNKGNYSQRVLIKNTKYLLPSGDQVDDPFLTGASPDTDERMGVVDLNDDDLLVLIKTFNNLVDTLEKQEQDRRELISNISHDIRTPLTNILGFLRAIMDGLVPPERIDQVITTMIDQVNKVENIFKGLNQATGDRELLPSIFDINDLMRKQVAGFALDAVNSQITIEEHYANKDEEILVWADSNGIDRVALNLLKNAMKFTPPGGMIRVTTLLRKAEVKNHPNSAVIVIVEDSGIGLSDEEMAKVFDRFFKVDRSRGNEGHGLGLHISKNIMNVHKQELAVAHSELGGARFSFTLEAAGGLSEEELQGGGQHD